MLIGITMMIGSFRRTVEIWVGSTLRADVYVTTDSWRRARQMATLDASLVDALRVICESPAGPLREAWSGSCRLGSDLETIVNKAAWESLPADLQVIIELANMASNVDMSAEYAHGNAIALQQLVKDPNVEIRRFPQDVMDTLRNLTNEVLDEMAAGDPAIAKIKKSFDEFREISAANQAIGRKAYLDVRD